MHRPGRCGHHPGGRGSRSTGREGGTGEVSSFGRRRLAVHRERGWDRGGVILPAAEARGPPEGRVGPGRCHPPGGGSSRSTGRECGTGEVSSSSRRRRLAVHRVSSSSGRRRRAVHREGGLDRGGVVILRVAEAREGGRDRGCVVILRAAEARGPPGGRAGPGRLPGCGGSRSTGREGGTGEVSSSVRRRVVVQRERGRGRGGGAGEVSTRRHPPGGGGSWSTGREGGTGETSSSSGRRRLAVQREGGWDRGGIILRAAEARSPPGERVGPGRCHPQGGGGSRSTWRESGTGEVSSSGRRRLALNREGGWDRRGVILREAEDRGPPRGRVRPGRYRLTPGGGGSRSSGRESATGEVSSSSGRQRIAVQREGGWDRGGVLILRTAESRGPQGGRAEPGRRRHPPGGGVSRSTGMELEGGTVEASSLSGRWRLTVHRKGGEARGPPGGRVGPGRCHHPPGGGGSRSTGREGGTEEVS